MANKLFTSLFIALLLPVFVAAFCPCGHAAPSNYLQIQSAPCHDCCPEMAITANTGCGILASAMTIEKQNGPVLRMLDASLSGLSGASLELGALSPGHRLLTPVFHSNETPLFILHQVFRI